MPTVDKLILSVKSSLKKKYDKDFTEVESLLKQLVKSDGQKGLTTELIFLDDREQLKPLGIAAVAERSAEKDFKNCIDALYKKYEPDYILIFGSIDIIPQQKLKNLLFEPGDDDDRWVPSDLPYACNEPYSTDPNTFLTPVRVVGRLADVNGINDVAMVSTMINNIVSFSSKPKQSYMDYFGVSALVWRKSTELTVNNIFLKSRLKLVPPSKYHWQRQQLKPLLHFFNCHGALADPNWYGQQGNRYPVAMASSVLQDRVQKNTIVAAECCYGAQMYHPAIKDLPVAMPICNAYFKNGAIGFLGSSTIAYGPSTTNDQADLITQYFFMNILGGASMGRALLEARQKYILNHGPDLSPVDLKTISQFNLLGDPSLHIVVAASQEQKKAMGIIRGKPLEDSSRKERRKYLLSKGSSLATFVNKVTPPKKMVTSKKSKTEINKLLTQFDMKEAVGKTFEVRQNIENRRIFKTSGIAKSKYHILIEKKRPGDFKQKLLAVKELDGQIVNVQVYDRK